MDDAQPDDRADDHLADLPNVIIPDGQCERLLLGSESPDEGGQL
jgi:hypothetical protein